MMTLLFRETLPPWYRGSVQRERSPMPFGIGLAELLVIFFILLLIFGAKRLSGLGRGVGQAIRGFKEEVKDPDDSKEDV